MSEKAIGIGLIGCGTVGRGVLELLRDCGEGYAARLGRAIEVRHVVARDPKKHSDLALPAGVLSDDAQRMLGDDEVSIVIEVAGGVEPIGTVVADALRAGKHVVTANKALLAARGPELFRLARENGVSIAFEASCAGGIPVLGAIEFGLAANRIRAVHGILNGTCNYILSQMTDEGLTYEVALADAQAEGYAEADPTLDVNGADAAQKLAIISTLAFGKLVGEADVQRQGIDGIRARDIAFASELGYRIKLLAIGECDDAGRIALRVQPCLVHADEPMARVSGAFNALSVFGHAVGHTLYYGPGAGKLPTASAVVGDLLAVASGWYPVAFERLRMWSDQASPAEFIGAEGLTARHYLRVDIADQPNVLSRIASILGSAGISISAVLQHEPDEDDEQACVVPLVITMHEAPEGVVNQAVREIEKLDAVRGEAVCMRIVEG